MRLILTEAYAMASRADLDFEVLVCDDGSTDETGEMVQELARELPKMRVVTHSENLGIARTFEDLYAESRKEFVFLNSTDGQWDTALLLELLPMTSQWDVIIASRYSKPYGLLRLLISFVFNLVPRIMFGVVTRDAGAVKLQRREIITRFPLISTSPYTEVERIVRATRAGYKYTYYPVVGAPRSRGRERGADWRTVVACLWDVARVWWAIRVAEPFVNGRRSLSS